MNINTKKKKGKKESLFIQKLSNKITLVEIFVKFKYKLEIWI